MVERVGVCWGMGVGGGEGGVGISHCYVKSAFGMGREVGGNCLLGFIWG